MKPKRKRGTPWASRTEDERALATAVLADLSGVTGREWKPATIANHELLLARYAEAAGEDQASFVTDAALVARDRWRRAGEERTDAERERRREFVQPSTLYRPTKWPKYLAHAKAAGPQSRGGTVAPELLERLRAEQADG